jgi:SHS2 domain-containing protein
VRRFEFIGHIADARMKIAGDSLEELFTAGVEGMFEFAKKGFCVGADNLSLVEKIEISSPDITALLIDFLSAVLTLSQEKKAVFCRVKFLKLTDTELEAEVFGSKVDSFNEDIKAVTYHEADVKKNPETGLYETNIVFDI